MSPLHGALTQYLATRRALGTGLRWPERSLRRFVDFVESEGAPFITTDLALRWAAASTGIQDASRARRLGIVRGFAAWLHATDPRTQIPPRGLLPSGQRRPTPHIYGNRDVASLMAAAHALSPSQGLRGPTYATLVGLLAATGLRPGEALALDAADVDLVRGILSVRESKFGKSRFVPLHTSTVTALAAYARLRDEILPCRDTPAFLVSGRGTRLRPSTARRTFAGLCQAVGLRPQTGPRRCGRGPRLQDIRHTFATRCLVDWYRDDRDVERLLPALSTYLGHGRVEETYWYLQAVPELLQRATERLQTRREGGTR